MEYPTLETLSTRRHYHRRIPLKKDVGFGSMLLLLVLVLESTQYSYPAHWSASYREPLRSTIGNAAVQKAIELSLACVGFMPNGVE